MSNADFARVERAIQFVERHFREQPSLDRVAASAGLSPHHFQRLFRRWAGISPKRFLQYMTVDHARVLLRESHNVLDTSLEVGLSGPGRLHDLLVTVDAVTPGEIKKMGKGLRVRYGFHPTPFGECLLATTDRGVCGLTFVGTGDHDAQVTELRQHWPCASLFEDAGATAPVVRRIFASTTGGMSAPFCLFVQGTNFQVKVWEALMRMPPGALISYGDLARAVDQPGAARAVGAALARNPIAFLIPCHRVIRQTGDFGSYRWGASRKRAMLGWESGQRERHPAWPPRCDSRRRS